MILRTQSWHLSTTRKRSVDQTTNLPFCSRFNELNLHGFGCTTSEREHFETGALSKRVRPHAGFPSGLDVILCRYVQAQSVFISQTWRVLSLKQIERRRTSVLNPGIFPQHAHDLSIKLQIFLSVHVFMSSISTDLDALHLSASVSRQGLCRNGYLTSARGLSL